MATENKCPHCGKPVPPTALQGICPECMLKAGLVETGEIGPGGTVVAKPSPQPVPRVEDIAPHFPQLEILECLGRGGMGAVYKARQPKLDRFVALKILTRNRSNGTTDAEFAERFQREARALARLNHPDIVAVYDFGEAGGFHYLLMEYVDGLTLRQLFQSRKLSPEEALTIVPKICEALQFAHERGIVHRDIKPENILLDKQGRVKIADFGIAKIVGQSAQAALTQDKQIIGTPHYMAPEQVEKPTTVDHRADIFSLGVVFYEMLTGELPLGNFQRPSCKVQVDVRLDKVVLHALEKEPDRRYQHVSEVKTDVETIAATPESSSRRREEVHSGKSAIRNPQSEIDQSPLTPATARWITAARWSARILGTLWLLIFLVFLVGEGSPPMGKQPATVQLEFAAMALMFAGCLVGWWRDLPAVLLTLGGWMLFQAAEQHLSVLSLFHVPLLAGVLFSVSWNARYLAKRAKLVNWIAPVAIPLFVVLLANGATRAKSALTPTVTSAMPIAGVSVPPVVIETIPQSGKGAVDPALTEIRVTFSKPMQDSSWSWSQLSDESFPQMTGEPKYLADQRTCVLPVRLLPGKVYAIWLNSEQHNNFKDREGRAALPYLLIFETRK